MTRAAAPADQLGGSDRHTGAGPIRQMLARARTGWRNGSLTLPAVVFVVVYAFLLLCIPSQLIIRPIGAPGTPANLWAIFALLWWIVATLGGQNPIKGFTPLRIALGVLAIAVLAGYAAGSLSGWYAPAGIQQDTDFVYSLVLVHAPELSERMLSAADRGLLSFAGWAGIILLTSEGLRSWRDLDLVVSWIAGLGAFVATIGIVQYFSGLNIADFFTIPGLSANTEFGTVDTRSVLNRVSGTARHPIEFGVVMAGLFWLSLHRSLFLKRSLVGWIPTILIGIALPMSVSRSAILALALGALIMFIGWPWSWRIKALVILPFVAVGMRLLAPGLIGTIRSLFTNLINDPSISGRTSDYSAVFAVFGDHPVFGRGLFTFIPRYYRILDNQMLMTMLELGIVGLVALLGLIITALALTRSARRRLTDPGIRHLLLALAASLAGVVFSYLTFDALGFPMVAGVTFLLVGLAGAGGYLSRGVRRAATGDGPPPATRSGPA